MDAFGDYGPQLMNQPGTRQQTDAVFDVWGDCNQAQIPEENVVKQKFNNLYR